MEAFVSVSGRPNLSSENLTLVGETFYDYEGRKSVDIMPVPSSDATLAYKSGFLPVSGDGCDCLSAPIVYTS